MNNIRKLANAVNDAKELVNVLKKIGFESVTQVYNQDATKKRILSLIYDELPKKIEKDDRLLFFFSGHGTTLKTKRNNLEVGYIVPYDYDNNNSSLIEFNEIVSKGIQNISAKHVLFLMDCCFSGYATSLRSIDINKTPIPSSPLDDYIQSCTKKDTIQIITAGGKEELVLDNSIFSGHSPFTGSIIYGLQTEEADLHKDGVITSTELGAYLTKTVFDVANVYGHKQLPIMDRLPGDCGGDFILMISKENITETLDEFRIKISKLSLKEKVGIIKDETKSTIITLIEDANTIALSYIAFAANLKELQTELISNIKVLGRMYLPKTKYIISIHGNEILLPNTNGYDVEEKLSVEIPTPLLQDYITEKIQLKEFWNKLNFYKKVPNVHRVTTSYLRFPLLI
jgi:Caspase domain